MMIPYLLRDLSAEQAQALSRNVKFPLVYTKVVIRNWESFQKLGVHEIYATTQPYSRIKLDYPVDLGGYNHQKDILAITVNRWSHGYAYFANSLFDDEEESEKTMLLARKPVGNVTIANSDSAWSAYVHAAIDEAHRAVGELG